MFRIYNQARVYGFVQYARTQYAGWAMKQKEGEKLADACEECGECEEKCPQKIPIREYLKEAHQALSG